MGNLDELKSNLDASFYSGSGFIGEDERSIEKIISDDVELMKKNDIDKDELEQLLKTVYKKVKNRLGQKVQLSDNLVGKYFESKGKIPSPFKEKGLFEKGEVEIERKDTEDLLIITELGLHLIEEYGFFQGKGSRYRIEPVKAYNMLKEIAE